MALVGSIKDFVFLEYFFPLWFLCVFPWLDTCSIFLKYRIFHFLDRLGCLFIHSLLEHLGGFEVWAIMNRATINIHRHSVGWAQVFSSFVKTRRHAAAESHASALVSPVICSLFSTQAGPLCLLSKQWGTVLAPHSHYHPLLPGFYILAFLMRSWSYLFVILILFVCLFVAILGIKPRVSYMLSHTPPLT